MLLTGKRGSSGASAFVDLTDGPGTIEALKVPRGNAGATALEWYTPTDSPFAWAADWVNVKNYGAAGVVTTTTLAAQLNAGSTSATLTSASSYAIGHGMAIPGAGAAGVELVVEITNVSSNVVTFTPATSTLVSVGQNIYHDDTQAFLDALATAKNVYVPVGYYNVQGGQYNNVIQMTNIGQRLQGGMSDLRMRTQSAPVVGSVIYSRSLTKDCIQMVANNTQVMDLTLAVDATLSASKTAGAGLVLGDISRYGLGASLGPSYGCVVERVGISHFWDGMRVEFSSGSFITKVHVSAFHRYGMYCTSGEPTGGNWFLDIQCYPLGYYSGTVVAGIYMDKFDTARWTNINAIGCPINFYLNATAGYIHQQIITGFTNENPTLGIGIKLARTGTYKVRACKFTGGEILVGGVYVGAGCEDNSFTGLTLSATSTYTGFDIYGTRTKIVSVDIGSWAGSASTDGIVIRSGADGTQVVGSSATLRQYGLVIENGATNNIIVGNNFNGNYTAGASLGSTARENSCIQGNYGVTDYGTSIASTPGYVGQMALSGGALHMAVGTSSSADWKQITA